MTSVPASIAAEAAITRQNVALSTIKQNAQAEQQLADIIDQSTVQQTAPVNGSRGTNVNLLV